jgi:two-component system chemotaxis response regulator CheY
MEKPVRALVIDDSKTMRKILGSIMREIDFEVFEAEDGVDALKRLEEIGCPDIALVDWNMPNMNGIELVRAVRKDASYEKMLIMMVTTEAEMENIIQALESGANEYVMKPFTKEAIFEKLEILGLTA